MYSTTRYYVVGAILPITTVRSQCEEVGHWRVAPRPIRNASLFLPSFTTHKRTMPTPPLIRPPPGVSEGRHCEMLIGTEPCDGLRKRPWEAQIRGHAHLDGLYWAPGDLGIAHCRLPMHQVSSSRACSAERTYIP